MSARERTRRLYFSFSAPTVASMMRLAVSASLSHVRPPPSVVVAELADSAINLELLIWVRDPSARSGIRAEYLEKVRSALDSAGISIPAPQREVRLLGRQRG